MSISISVQNEDFDGVDFAETAVVSLSQAIVNFRDPQSLDGLANDLIVAQRQKGTGMHWSEQTSDGLAALKTLMLNGGWDRYWADEEVLPLAA